VGFLLSRDAKIGTTLANFRLSRKTPSHTHSFTTFESATISVILGVHIYKNLQMSIKSRHKLETRDVEAEAEAGSRSGGSGPFSVEAEARKFFCFHIGYLT